MTDFLLILGMTIFLNVCITLIVLNKYTFDLTVEISKMLDNNLSAMKATTNAIFEVRKQIFKELNKQDKD